MTVKKTKKLYIVSEFVDEKTNSTGYFWFKIIKGLVGDIKDINVISLDQSCRKAANKNTGVTYVPIKNSVSQRANGFLGKLLGNIVLSLKFSFKVLRFVKSKDLVFSGTNPSILVLFIAMLKPLIKFRWILLVNDIFPENLLPAKLISNNSYIYKTVRVFFDFAYRRADRIIVIGRDMQIVVEKKTNNQVRVDYIPNWVDLDDVSVLSKNNFLPFCKERLEDRVVFQFFGNMGVVQGLDILLSSISETKNKKAKFVFIGSGSGVDLVREFIKTSPRQDITIYSPIEFKDNNVGLSACDIAIVSLAPGMFGLAVPSKAYFSLAADKPIFVIGDKGAELEYLINDNSNIGWYCASYNTAEVANMLDEICEIDLSAYHNKPRSVIANQHSYHSVKAQYINIINELS
jgi:glycosyltransferase involved in cell wall biosynthesis